MKQTGVIVKGNGMNCDEATFNAHCDGKRTKDCGAYIEVGVGEYEPMTRPLYEGFGKRV
jgi:hypothetical protein